MNFQGRELPGLKAASGLKSSITYFPRIKAWNWKTEILWIFFGIHTVNAVLMIDKVASRTAKAA